VQTEPTARRDTAEAEKIYNPVFERLVEASDQPLTGAIAYAFYKSSKREWVLRFRQETGRPPTDEDLRQFVATQTKATLDGYRAQAEQILANYASDVIKDERPKILAEAPQGDLWRAFWPSFRASVGFTSVLLLLALIAAILGYGLPVQINIPGA
jgi:hypothetical protein